MTFRFPRAAALASAGLAILLSACATSGPKPPPRTLEELPKASALRLNQVGFETGGPKIAILASGAAEPLEFRVVNGEGDTVLEGETTPFGLNEKSGEYVHQIDFSALQTPGEGYTLRVGRTRSHPFVVEDRPFAQLAKDAIAYFYHNRSGVPIRADLVGPEWARPAGHLPDFATCFAGTDMFGVEWDGCDYSLDGTGGWYDAGDQGKYVVNGGIATWTMLNYYERASQMGGELGTADGVLAIPEAGNGLPDVLDEARVEMEFLLSMQVPDGKTARVPVGKIQWGKPFPAMQDIDASGMAHQKLASIEWTPIPTVPHEDLLPRKLYPPTTAATLNLAATAAQCARVFRGVDDAFSARCYDAAIKAFDAALRNPEVYATSSFDGSGGYGDGNLKDEFFWAATELWITTWDDKYEDYAEEFAPEVPFANISWGSVEGLGVISLALAPDGLNNTARDVARTAVIATAETYKDQIDNEGYHLPFGKRGYVWGSNGDFSNHAIVLAYAADFTGDPAYRDAAISVVDYILGRNPLDQSYVAGYGARPLLNPHHRFWAFQADPRYPSPPPGALSGGANNTNMSDPVASTMKGTCEAQTCWRDNYEAFALNEVAINWNAPFFWAVAWLDDTAHAGEPEDDPSEPIAP